MALASKPNLCFDVINGCDNRGQDVQLYTRQTTIVDAQLVQVVKDGSYYRIRIPLTGKYIDFPSFESGKSLNQWDYATYYKQLWDFVPVTDSSGAAVTVTVDGKVCPEYYIKNSHVDGSTVLAIDACGGAASAQAGTDIWLYTFNSTDAQKWIFIPQNVVRKGTYFLRSALDPNVDCDVANGGTGNGNPIQVYSWNGGNNQVVCIEPQSDGTTIIRDMNSGKLYSCGGGAPKSGDDCYIWDGPSTGGGATDQKWVIVQTGTSKRNGNMVPTYEIKNKAGSDLCLDVTGGSTALANRIQLWSDNNSLAQRFMLDPAEAEGKYLPAPCDYRLRFPDGRFQTSPWGNCPPYNGITDGIQNSDGTWTTKFYLAFNSFGTGQFEVRYRLKKHKAQNHGLITTTNWMSVKDGSTSNGGWGETWQPNVNPATFVQYKDPNVLNSMWVCPNPISITVGRSYNQFDLIEVEIQARTYSDDYDWDTGVNGLAYAHGPTTTGTLNVVWSAYPTFSAASISPDGIKIPYTSTLVAESTKASMTCSAVDSNGTIVFNSYKNTDLSSTDSFDVPYSSISHIPSDGSTIKVTYTCVTEYGVSRTGTQSITISEDTDHGIVVKPTFAYDKTRRAYLCTFTKGTTNGCWIKIDHGHSHNFEAMPLISSTDTTVTYLAIPKLNTTCEVWTKAYNSDTQWGYNRDTIPAIVSDDAVWNWSENSWNGCSALTVDKDDPPTHSYILTPDSETHSTSGREHNVVSFGKTVTGKFKSSGLIVESYQPKIPRQSEVYFDWLAYTGPRGQDVIYRDPQGFWARVAITDIQQEHQQEGIKKVDVSMTEVTP